MGDVIEKVVEYLKWHPNARPSEIANYLGINIKLVRAILAKLRQKGIVVRTEKGYVLRPTIDFTSIILQPKESPGIEFHREEGAVEKSAGSKDIPRVAIDKDIEMLKSKIAEFGKRIHDIEKRVAEVGNSLDDLKTRIDSYIGYGNSSKVMIELIDILDILKMCLQAIAVGDIESLGSLLEDLEDAVERLKTKIRSNF